MTVLRAKGLCAKVTEEEYARFERPWCGFQSRGRVAGRDTERRGRRCRERIVRVGSLNREPPGERVGRPKVRGDDVARLGGMV